MSCAKIPFQSSVNFITAAWRKRAKKWGDVLLDEDSKVNKEVSYRPTIEVVFVWPKLLVAAGARYPR